MFDSITSQFTILDWVFVIWMGFSILLGLIRGFISEVLSLIGWVISFSLANHYAADLGAKLPLPIKDTTPAYFVGYLAIFIGSLLAWTMIRTLLRFAVGKGFFDYLLGLTFGVLRGFLVAMVAISLVSVLIPLPSQNWWKKAYFHSLLESGALQFRSLLPANWGERLQITPEDLPNKEAMSFPLTTPSNMPSDTQPSGTPSMIKSSSSRHLDGLPSSLPSHLDHGLLPTIPRSAQPSN